MTEKPIIYKLFIPFINRVSFYYYLIEKKFIKYYV